MPQIDLSPFADCDKETFERLVAGWEVCLSHEHQFSELDDTDEPEESS